MNIVVAMDGSRFGRWGLNWVARLPLVKTPTVTALHVLDIGALRAPFITQSAVVGSERFIQQEIKRMEQRAAETLASARRQMTALQLNGKTKKERGTIASVILRQVPKKDGLLVVGSHGRNALDRFMLGSVSTNILHHASCPLLITKADAEPLRRIVLAVDGSVSSKKALNFLLKEFRRATSGPRAVRTPVHITVVHAMPFLNYPELKNAGSRLVEEYSQKLAESGFSSEGVCRLGHPADQIIEAASKDKASLIVMGAKGLGAVARFFLGSVSTRVVQRATQTVLVVR